MAGQGASTHPPWNLRFYRNRGFEDSYGSGVPGRGAPLPGMSPISLRSLPPPSHLTGRFQIFPAADGISRAGIPPSRLESRTSSTGVRSATTRVLSFPTSTSMYPPTRIHLMIMNASSRARSRSPLSLHSNPLGGRHALRQTPEPERVSLLRECGCVLELCPGTLPHATLEAVSVSVSVYLGLTNSVSPGSLPLQSTHILPEIQLDNLIIVGRPG